MAVVLFFLIHAHVSVFFQSFFQHRYCSHRQFTMSKRAERVTHWLAWIVQGSGYLSPRGYAPMHRMHHAFSDTERDPHSPTQFRDVFRMMWTTAHHYHDLAYRTIPVDAKFDGGFPESRFLDGWGTHWTSRVMWGAVYTLIYTQIATAWWQYLLLPAHWVLAPIHGAIVNWCGHKYGYRNFASDDQSKNTLPFDVVTGGELFQNNHHKFPMSPNFAARRWEIDPTYQVMRVLQLVGVIDMRGSQRMRWPERAEKDPAQSNGSSDRLAA